MLVVVVVVVVVVVDSWGHTVVDKPNMVEVETAAVAESVVAAAVLGVEISILP
jgi:hypothetical protein